MNSPDTTRENTQMKRSIREKLLFGDPLHFSGNEPEKERLIKAEWLAEAARKPAKIDVRRAVIRGTLDLQYVTFEKTSATFTLLAVQAGKKLPSSAASPPTAGPHQNASAGTWNRSKNPMGNAIPPILQLIMP